MITLIWDDRDKNCTGWAWFSETGESGPLDVDPDDDAEDIARGLGVAVDDVLVSLDTIGYDGQGDEPLRGLGIDEIHRRMADWGQA